MIAVGAVDARSVRVWVRTREPGPHNVEIVSDGSGVRHYGIAALCPAFNSDGTTSFLFPDEIPGARDLESSTAFRIRVARGDNVIGEASFETAPANAASTPASFAFALMSCHEPFDEEGALHEEALATLNVLDGALRERNVKRVLLMGDQMYADYPTKLSLFDDAHLNSLMPHRRSILECTRDEIRALYQRRHRAFWSIEPFRNLLRSYPCYPVPDDHEIRDNFGSAPADAEPPWQTVRDGALDAFDDYQGQLTGPSTAPRRSSFDYSIAYGDVGVYGLDVRSQRRHDGERLHVCSDEQFTAFERYLHVSSALQVLMVVTSVPLAIYPSWVASLGARLLGRDSDAAERWSHPDATDSRRRMTSLLYEHQRRNPHQRVLLLGGDIHIGCAVKFIWRDPDVRPMYQLVSSSVSNLQEALRRKLGRIAPHLDPHLSGGADDLWERIELVHGVPEAKRNPFDGLNAGIVSMTKSADGTYDVTFELVSHDTEGGAHAVFAASLV